MVTFARPGDDDCGTRDNDCKKRGYFSMFPVYIARDKGIEYNQSNVGATTAQADLIITQRQRRFPHDFQADISGSSARAQKFNAL